MPIHLDSSINKHTLQMAGEPKNNVFIPILPCITLTTTQNSKFPFTFSRREFPLKQSYAMTINKSQGQTLKRVIYLPQPMFTHGQLYMAMSRVTSYRVYISHLANHQMKMHATQTMSGTSQL